MATSREDSRSSAPAVQDDTIKAYRAAAEKASQESQAFAADADKSASGARNVFQTLDELKKQYSEDLTKLRDFEGKVVRFEDEVLLVTELDWESVLGLKKDDASVHIISPPDAKSIYQRWIVKHAPPR